MAMPASACASAAASLMPSQSCVLQRPNALQLTRRIKPSLHFVNARLPRNRHRRHRQVPSQHQHPQPTVLRRNPLQRRNRLSRIGPQRIARIEVANRQMIQRHPQPRHPWL
jgi:hypothetical protein